MKQYAYKISKKIVVFAGLFGVFPSIVLAQTPSSPNDLNRQMEVTRAYEPTVDEATKINIKPDMVDTMTLRPDVSYGITPTPISYGFEVQPIRAAQVNTSMYRNLSPLYIKAGLGVPFQSLFDLYYSSTKTGPSKYGLYANHYGQWSKIKNDFGDKAPASETFNSIGVFGSHQFSRMSVGGEIGYDYDKISRYGYHVEPIYDVSASTLRQNFSTIRGNLYLGHSFEDLSYFNFRIGVDAYYLVDHFKYGESGFKAYVDLGKQFGNNNIVTLRIQYDNYSGAKNLDYDNDLITVSPLYRLNTDRFKFALGVDFVHSALEQSPYWGMPNGKKNKLYFYPKLEAKVDIGSGYFVPYLAVDGSLNNNGYRNTLLQNPYVVEGWTMSNTSQYNGRLGFTGSFSSAFSYKVYGGMTFYKDLNFFLPLPVIDNLFGALASDAHYWTIGAEIQGRISGAFDIDAGIQYYGYSVDDFDHPFNLPNLTANLDLKYKYRDKLILSAGVKLIGKRHLYGWTTGGDYLPYPIEEMDPVVNLTFGAEYNISRKIGVFVQGNNLLNKKLYQFQHYPGLGISAIAGVKVQF